MGTGHRRSLVIRIGALGDVLLTRRLTYSLSLEGYRSTLFAPGRHASLLLADPWIDAVVDSESADASVAFGGRWSKGPRGFEAAVVISKSAELAKAAGEAAPNVIVCPPTPTHGGLLVSTQWAQATAALAPPASGPLPLLSVDVAEPAAAGAVFIHPGSGSTAKNWPVERFIALGRALAQTGHRVVWIQGPAETPVDVPSAFEVVTHPSLQTLAAALSKARLYVGNDSGISHLAGATGAPTLAIFGPTDPEVWRPDGPRVRAVRASSSVLEDVATEDVLSIARAMAGGQESGL